MLLWEGLQAVNNTLADVKVFEVAMRKKDGVELLNARLQ